MPTMTGRGSGRVRRAAAMAVVAGAASAGVVGSGVGCRQRAAVVDDSLKVNSGVNIVPKAVLAAERVRPSTAPAADGLPDLIDTVGKQDHAHYAFLEVLRHADLVPTLQAAGPYTVLAPTDAAFAKLPPGTLESLLKPEHKAELVAFAKYHLLSGRVTFDDMRHTNGIVAALSGAKLVIKGIDAKVTVNDSNVIQTDTTAGNGIVHWIDSVLMPPTTF